MFYFKFAIPVQPDSVTKDNPDGTTVTYSPGWCGTRDKCALKEKGIYYNDKERWGIAIAEGSFVPPDVEVVDAGKVAELMGIKTVVDRTAVIAMDAEGSLKFNNVVAELPEITEKEVYYGKKLVNREADRIKAEEAKRIADKAIADAIAKAELEAAIKKQRLEDLEEPVIGEVV
jgi:hypothetical protein